MNAPAIAPMTFLSPQRGWHLRSRLLQSHLIRIDAFIGTSLVQLDRMDYPGHCCKKAAQH